MIRHLSKGSGGYDSHNDDHGNRQLFDGFPFFVTRIVPGLHNIILLPIDMDVASLIEFSISAFVARKLRLDALQIAF